MSTAFDRLRAQITPGSIVLHPLVVTGALRQQIEDALARAGLSIDAFTVGHADNAITPEGDLLF
jgi:hypothetical protein